MGEPVSLLAEFADAQARRRKGKTNPLPEEIRQAIMGDLARAFYSSLEGAAGLDPWQPLALIAWANFHAPPGSAASCTVRFLLGVWDPSRDWSREGLQCWWPFDIGEALNLWSSADRKAFAQWVEMPLWP